MTQNKARRTNKIDLLQLPVTAEAAGSSPVVPTILFNYLSESGFGRNCPKLSDKTAALSTFLGKIILTTALRFALGR